MAQKFANAARAALAAEIASGSTTITIVSGGSLFPEIVSPDFARAVLQDANGIEIVLITAHTANATSFTVTRAQEGTTARSFAAGAVFGIRVTAADMDEALDAVNLAAEVTGTLLIVNGGTGETTRQAAMDALAGAVTSGQYLRGNGTNAVMSAIQVADVPLLNQNTTGQAGSVANALTAGSFLTSGGTFNGAAARTFAVDATSANTADKVVARDASGNFSAGTITAALSGNASTATTASNVNNGTLTMNVSGTGLSGSQTFTANQAGNATFTVTSNATNANTGSTIVARDASGNFSAGTITAALTGNASGSSGSCTGNSATATTATNATNTAITNDTTTATAQFITFVAASSGNTGQKTHSTGLTFVPSTGAFTASGNVTAFSDERFKKDWGDLPVDFLEQLAKVKHGTYTRTDSEERQMGVSAQTMRTFAPEVVLEDSEGRLSLAYGNAALVAAVKLAERVVALEARLAALEARG